MNIPNDVDERGKDMCEQPDNRNDGDKKIIKQQCHTHIRA